MFNVQKCWINQPSKLQPYHKLHGKLVWADFNNKSYDYIDSHRVEYVMCFFIDTSIQGFGWERIPKGALSYGWPDHLKAQARGS